MLSVIWPIFLMFSVKICKILMFSVLKKLTVKYSKVLEQRFRSVTFNKSFIEKTIMLEKKD